MPTVEIDELEYAQLKRVSSVADRLAKNPKSRELMQRAIAEEMPEEAGPEIRIRQEVDQRLAGIEKLLQDDREERAKDRDERKAEEDRRALEQRWLSGRSKARDAGYTDEGLDELEKFMEATGIADHENAIPAFERKHPPPEPQVTGGSRWNFFDVAAGAGEQDAAMKALMGQNYDGFLDLAVPQALKDVRGR